MSFFLDFLKTYVRLPFFLMLGLVACVNGFFLAAKLTALTNLPQALIVLLSFTYVILALFSLYLFCYALSYVMVLWRVVLVGLLLGVRLFFGGEELFLLHNVTGEESFEEVLGVACLQLLINYCIVINGALSALEVLLLLLPCANSSLVFWHNLEGSIGASSLTSTLDIFKGNAMKNASKLLQYIQVSKEVPVPKVIPQVADAKAWNFFQKFSVPAIVDLERGSVFLTKGLAKYGLDLRYSLKEQWAIFEVYQQLDSTYTPFFKHFALDVSNFNAEQMVEIYGQIYKDKSAAELTNIVRSDHVSLIGLLGKDIAQNSKLSPAVRWSLFEGDIPRVVKFKDSRMPANVIQEAFGVRNTLVVSDCFVQQEGLENLTIGETKHDAMINGRTLEVKFLAPIRDPLYFEKRIIEVLAEVKPTGEVLNVFFLTDVKEEQLPYFLEKVREKNVEYAGSKIVLAICDEKTRKIFK